MQTTDAKMTLKVGSRLPNGWRWSRLSNVIEINPPPPSLALRTPVPFLAMANVSERGTILGNDTRIYSQVRNGFTSFRNGDVLIAKIRPCFENGKGALVKDLVSGVGFGSTEFHVLRAGEHIDPLFLFMHTTIRAFRRHGKANMTGSAGQMRLPASFIRDWVISLPPMREQRRIADILGTWDRAVMAAEGAQHRVTRLYLGIADKMIRLRGSNVRPLADVLIPDRMEAVEADGPFRALGVRSHGKGTFHRIDDLATLGSTKTLYRVEAGRFIVNIVFAWEGAAAITSAEDAGCLVSHRFPTFSINENVLSPKYFSHVIRTEYFRQLLALASPGGAGRNKTLNRHDLLRFEMHLPPLAKQRQAAEILSTLDHRAKSYERYVHCLVTQRDALASELLTGRLRVADAERLDVTAAG